MNKLINCMFFLLLIAATAFPGTDHENPARCRFAFIVSSNKGKGKPTLTYSDKDAVTIQEILKEMGGVKKEDMILLPCATVNSLNKKFEEMGEHISNARKNNDKQTEIFFYYS